MLTTVFVSLALAQDPSNRCQITSEHPDVHASMTRVSIDGHVYPVVGGGARFAFASMLHECGMSSAAFAFDRWRQQRRTTNVTAVVGALVFWPVLIVTPFSATAAGSNKNEMVAAIIAHQ